MKQYFKKLDIDMSDLDFSDMNSGIAVHNPRNLDFTYYDVKEEYKEVLLSKIPENLRSKVTYIAYAIAGGPHTFSPHRDRSGINVINYYIKTGLSETSFFEPTVENPRVRVIDGVEYPGWFDYTDLTKVTSFKAVTGDCYMLDVSSIHDLALFTNEKRHFIQYIFQENICI